MKYCGRLSSLVKRCTPRLAWHLPILHFILSDRRTEVKAFSVRPILAARALAVKRDGAAITAATASIRIRQLAACPAEASATLPFVQLWRRARTSCRCRQQGQLAAMVQAARTVGLVGLKLMSWSLLMLLLSCSGCDLRHGYERCQWRPEDLDEGLDALLDRCVAKCYFRRRQA